MKVSLAEMIGKENSFEYFKLDACQILIVNLPNTLRIKITVADDVFEWYVEIFNSTGQSLTSKWYDHYDDSDKNLVEEMKNAIIEFIDDITKNKSRVILKKKVLRKKIIFQILKNGDWIDY